MVKNRWQVAVGIGLIALGPGVFAANHPAGDMIWEWPSFGILIWGLGIIVLGTGLPMTSLSNERSADR